MPRITIDHIKDWPPERFGAATTSMLTTAWNRARSRICRMSYGK